MKEFSAQTGGRYTYADDLENIQELALAFSQIFDDCDNFIISGCEVLAGNISAGYVFINGKIRYFSGSTGISSWPQYIYELNTTESVPYESGGTKIGRNSYSCAIAKSVPVSKDALTGKVPQSITISSSGGLRMKDAFFGKYALLLNPSSGSQSVNSVVNLMKAVNTEGDFTANKGITVKSGIMKAELNYSGSTFSIKYTGQSNNYTLSWIDGVGVRFFANGAMVATIGSSTISFHRPVVSSEGVFGGLAITGNQIYQNTSNATSEIQINVQGYNGGTTQFRSTHIGNGKGRKLFSVIGENNSVNLYGVTTLNAGTANGLILKADSLKENHNLTNAIAWSDSGNTIMARVGFIDTDSNAFSISVPLYAVNIVAKTSVNIGPSIMENGVLLENKYATLKKLNDDLAVKANASSVYTMEQSNNKFGLKGDGLSQFVSSAVSADTCRSQIGAIGQNELDSYSKLSMLLSDMATDESKKKQIRKNIGAAGVGDFQPKMIDSGWKHIQDSLYVRQIGNIVCIQGSARTIHSGTIFTIPNSIAAPSHSVKHSIAFSNKKSWVCKIDANQRACKVVYCSGSCGDWTEFTITYMV